MSDERCCGTCNHSFVDRACQSLECGIDYGEASNHIVTVVIMEKISEKETCEMKWGYTNNKLREVVAKSMNIDKTHMNIMINHLAGTFAVTYNTDMF